MQTESEMLAEKYLQKILEVNQKINLTRITDEQEARLLHLEDSLSVLDDLDDAPSGLYGDLGSGGGFPGVPLAIYSQRQTLLVDSVKKKMAAVQEILHILNLDEQIKTYGGRIEELTEEHRGEFAVLTARALSSLDSLLELACPLLQMHGRLICLKAQIGNEELNRAKDLEEMLGLNLLQTRTFNLSDGETFRTVLVFEKFKEPEIKLPRRTGMAQKKPLKRK